MIEQWQVDQYHQQGFLVVEHVLTSEEIAALQHDFDQWVEESRRSECPRGNTQDGRSRFDIESDHSADHPSLRRVSLTKRHLCRLSPCGTAVTNGADCRAVNWYSGARYHHSKINSKLPHTATKVEWHQDFLFTPHSNDDIVTALLMVSEVTPENGPLNVVPGSHRGPLYSHWQDGRFTGGRRACGGEEQCQQPSACFGPPGPCALCTQGCLHASSPNETEWPRTLFIAVYAAEDALPFGENPAPGCRNAGLW
ncbi:phytanoyl-CoA dioxygenase family protein [Pantoea ananatis]